MATLRASSMCRVVPNIQPSIDATICLLANSPPTPISLSKLFEIGNDFTEDGQIRYAQLLHRELPLRFSQRIEELRALPHGLSTLSGVADTRTLYKQCVEAIVNAEFPRDQASQRSFKALVRELLERKNEQKVVQTMALAVRSQYAKEGLDVQDKLVADMDSSRWQDVQGGWTGLEPRLLEAARVRSNCDRVLNRFYMARIGLRFITEQYLHSAQRNTEGWSGVLHSRCDPVQVANMAAADVEGLAYHHMGQCPPIVVRGEPGGAFTYIPKHMHYILAELLKNACRAVVHAHRSSEQASRRRRRRKHDLPPVEVVVVHGAEDVAFKISDQGGGIPRSSMPSVWTYMYSTAQQPGSTDVTQRSRSSLDVDRESVSQTGALAGYGVGLPMSRLYARYFGGELDIQSIEGLGTDCYVHLPKLGESCENLPEMVLSSPGNQVSTQDSNNPVPNGIDLPSTVTY